LQDQRQQNEPEKKTKDSFHQEYEPAAVTKQRILFQHVSVLMSVVAAHLATMIFSLRGFYSNRQFFNSLNHLQKLMSMHS